MHLVHYKDRFNNIGEAVASGEDDALAVLGVLFEVGLFDNQQFAPIINALSSIQNYPSEVNIANVTLADLIPKTDSFIRYFGSLTTPTCNEIVVWTVLRKTIKLSSAQFAQFRSLFDRSDRPLVNNFRPVQFVNGREVGCYLGLYGSVN